MYRILYNESTIFDPYGNENEVVTDASMSVEINAAAYLDFTMSRLHPLYDTIAERDGVVTLYWDRKILFQGVVESIDMDIQGNKSISCVSALDYLNDTVVRPYSTIAGEQELTAPSSVDGYFQWLIDQHNDHVLDAGKLFDVGVNQGANLQQNNFIYRSSTNNPTTASEITDQLLDSLGGYLTMRYVDDRRVLDLYSDIHTMNAQIIDFGVNITDFSKTIDTKDQYTALLLKGGSPEFLGGDFEDGSFDYWVSHPNTPIATSTVHGGTYSSFFTEGNGEYINSSFFYAKKGARYKSTVWIKNERSSTIKAYPRYQVYEAGDWVGKIIDGSYDVPNDGEWHEYSFDFMPNLEDYVRIRPRWVFDTVGNDGNKRVYVDDFDFRQVEGDTDVTEDPISVAMVPDGGMHYDANILKTGDVIYDPTAVARYGYKEKVHEDSTITDVDDLLQAGVKELNKLKDPQIGLDIKAVDLALFMDGYDHLNVGDAVRVRSAIHDTDEFLMVTSITLDLQDPGQSEYNIGKAYDSLTGQQSGFLRSLNSGINSSLDAVASLDQTTKDQAIQIGSVEQVANQAQQTANANKQSIADIEKQQSEQDKLLEHMQAGVEQAEQEIGGINDRLDQMDTEAGEVQASIDAVRQEARTNFETAQAAADAAQAKADSVGADLESFRTETGESIQNVKDSVSGVRSDVDAVTQKASDLASDLDGTKATVEQVTTDLGEVKTTVSNAATKADQALQVSTSASQTATEARTTATSAYQDAKSALTQSSVASQTANAVKTELETKYSTTDEIAEQYATKSLVEQTSQSITSTVEATYATKATVEALENIANNAVQTWMGSGAPTLSNKPASDWNTAELKAQHSGDIYYDTNTGYSYRFGSSDGSNYSWSLIKDTDISKAIADAAKAQQTAEGVSDEVTQLKTDIPATYATKTEVKQTTDSIKSSVSEVATTANSALSKATTVEQTANGLQTTVTEQAKKLNSAVTTISQVSQRVDSVSSTITQVQGDVADVDAKADTAQGTANSALSQASRVEQNLNSFKTSVSRDYQTKTDALSQKSELEQNINSFKTTVSETYTTKDEFDALEIGGTNLIKNSDFSRQGEEWAFGGDVSAEYGTDASMGTYVKALGSSSGIRRFYQITNGVWHKGEKLVYSFYAKSDDETPPAIDLSRSLIDYGQKHTLSNTWTRYTGSITSTDTPSTGGTLSIRFVNTGVHTALITKIKLERGTKPTAWSPAPEDFDGKYTSKTEFKQTTDKISATATAASQNASSALSKISSLEVSVDGIDTRVEEVASDADEAVRTASQVSQRVDSLSSTITQVRGDIDAINASVELINPDFETGDITGWVVAKSQGGDPAYVNNFNPNSGTYKLVIPSMSKDGDLSIVNDATFSVKEGDKYRVSVALYPDTKIPGSGYVNIGFHYSDGSNNGFVKDIIGAGWHSYSDIVTIPSGKKTAQFRIGLNVASGNAVRVDSVKIENVTDAMTATSTANSALSKSSSVEQNLNSFKTSVSQTYETKSDASSKQSSLQQSVNNLRTEVSETYTTKTDFENLQVGGTNLIRNSNFSDSRSDWSDWGSPSTREIVTINSKTWAHIVTSKQVFQGYQQKTLASQTIHGGETYTFSCLAYAGDSSSSKFTVGIHEKQSNGAIINQSWHTDDTLGSDPKRIVYTFAIPENCEQFNVMVGYSGTDSVQNIYFTDIKLEVGAKPTDWSPAPEDMLSTAEAAQTYSTKSYVDQTARTVSLGVVEEYKNGQHGSALATQSDITATKNSITSTVSQTYLSKTDATNTYLNKNTAASTYATKTEVKQTSDSLTVTINEALDVANSAASSIQIKNSSFETGDLTGWTTQGFSNVRVTSGNAVGAYRFEGNLTALSGDFAYLRQNGTIGLVPGHTYRLTATRAYLDAKQQLIFCVRRLSDNSRLTPYDALIGGDGIWRSIGGKFTVPSSYASDETYRVEAIVNRNSTNRFLIDDISITDVTDANSAQSTANTANTNAINANNRVGNLETCIKMTSDGVRVGKISNGNFTGYSALVNSAGSFDILDSSTKTLASFNKDGLRVNSSSDRGMIIGFNPNTDSGYIGSTPRSTSIGEDYVDIGMNMDFSSGGDLGIIDRLGRINLIGNGIQLMTTGDDRVGINFMDVRGAGVVLFDKDDSHNYSSIEIPIGHNFSEFNYIMCFFKTNDGQYFGGTAYHPNGKEYCFTTMGGGAGTTDMSYLKGTRWVFNGTKATRKTTFQIGPGYSTAVNDAVLHIVAIVGFDYYKTSG